MQTKLCSRCKLEKSSDEFHKKTKASDGLQPYCKPCAKQKMHAWYEDNKEQHRANVSASARKGWEWATCADCGEAFQRNPTGRKRGACGPCLHKRRQAPCPACERPMSHGASSCRSCVDMSGENSPNWAGGRTVHSKGYVQVSVSERGYVFEHILIMEGHLGRRLVDGETVHHRNGVRCDNRLENLELWAKPQPTGVRAVDILAWAHEIIERYESLAQEELI